MECVGLANVQRPMLVLLLITVTKIKKLICYILKDFLMINDAVESFECRSGQFGSFWCCKAYWNWNNLQRTDETWCFRHYSHVNYSIWMIFFS